MRSRGGATGTLIFASAALGWPPFYGVSLAAGALKIGLPLFVVLGLLRRGIRFAVLAWSAHSLGSGAVGEITLFVSSVPVLGG